MADLTTFAQIEAELAVTATFDVDGDVAMAKRRLAALRRKLDFPSQIARGENNLQFAISAIENQIAYILAWISANADATETARLSNPDVTHADWRMFRRDCA